MQTFLPVKTYSGCAQILDYRRLGKQRLEAYQLIQTLEGRSTGWASHPACKMWEGHVEELKLYYNEMRAEWIKRGYKNTMPHLYVDDNKLSPTVPFWYNMKNLYSSHRSNLLRKNYNYYSQFGWTDDPNAPYYWPTNPQKYYDYLQNLRRGEDLGRILQRKDF